MNLKMTTKKAKMLESGDIVFHSRDGILVGERICNAIIASPYVHIDFPGRTVTIPMDAEVVISDETQS